MPTIIGMPRQTEAASVKSEWRPIVEVEQVAGRIFSVGPLVRRRRRDSWSFTADEDERRSARSCRQGGLSSTSLPGIDRRHQQKSGVTRSLPALMAQIWLHLRTVEGREASDRDDTPRR